MMNIGALREQGVGPAEIRSIRKKSTRLTHGVYVKNGLEPLEQYKQKCHVVLGRLKSGAALAGPSAAAMWDLPLIDPMPEVVYVCNITPGSYAKDVKVLSPRDVLPHDGLLLSDPASVVRDFAQHFSSIQTLIVADAALTQPLCSLDDLDEVAGQMVGRRGAGHMRWVAQHADPLSESPGESWARLLGIQLGYDLASQFHVTNGKREAYLDLLVEGTKVGIEFDGLVKYRKRGVGKVIQEHLREGDLQEMGYALVRLIWCQLTNIEQLDKRLQHAGAQPTRPRQLMTW